MACRALFGALGVIAVFLMPAFAGSAGAAGNNQDTAPIEKPALPDEIPAPAAAPRAEQIKPVMVEPVKRVAPKVPDNKTSENKIKQVVTIEKDPTINEDRPAAKSTKSLAKSAAEPCDSRNKRSKDGAKCEKVANAAKKGGKRR